MLDLLHPGGCPVTGNQGEAQKRVKYSKEMFLEMLLYIKNHLETLFLSMNFSFWLIVTRVYVFSWEKG